MATPLKTLVLRLPSRPAAGLTSRCCRTATLTTAARQMNSLAISSSSIKHSATLRPSSSAIVQQLRHNSNKSQTQTHSSAAQKSIDANQFRTATDLNSKTPTGQKNPADYPPSRPADQPQPLDWNSFFKLRLRRRRVQIFFSAATGLVGLVACLAVLPTGIAEPLVTQIPLDPFVSMGLLTVVIVGAGWLVGPSVGSQVFNLRNHKLKRQIAQKEAEFFARIKKNRVDPANSSAANPVPDFYGEKIQSVHGYRQWLKDQRAFNKKKSADLI